MNDSAHLLGHNTSEIENDLKDILEFQIKLSNLTKANLEQKSIADLYNKMSIKNLSNLNPCVPWLDYINIFLTKELIQVNGSDEIIVTEPYYVRNLYNVMKNTSLKVVNNFVRWKIVQNSIPYLNKEASIIREKYISKIYGTSGPIDRSLICVEEANKNLQNAVGAMYVRSFFKNGSKEDVEEMIGNTREVFYQMIIESDWMTNGTKASALEKALAMFNHVGYPAEYLDNDTLTERYNGLELNSLDYFGNKHRIWTFDLDFSIKSLNKRVNKTSWIYNGESAVVNAYYSTDENSLIFPAGMLQGMFFSVDRPTYLNLGGIGWIIGHEISHGFDNVGSQIDKDGNLFNWWDNVTAQIYEEKIKCLKYQYGNYTVESVNVTVDGEYTLEENIADNMGIRNAYLTFLKWKTSQTERNIEYLPGFDNYTINQAFWLSAANDYCIKMTSKTEKQRAETLPYAPEIYRIIGSFSNQPEFSSDFNCLAGSKMNRTEKCKLW
uniref:Membrane metalloendopeptidaselike 1like [Megachile rotundata] n=1 Tax=Lepeophtheirus salmonis TaxID=72036 RepID=A0A0K2V1Z6_LEPSM